MSAAAAWCDAGAWFILMFCFRLVAFYIFDSFLFLCFHMDTHIFACQNSPCLRLTFALVDILSWRLKICTIYELLLSCAYNRAPFHYMIQRASFQHAFTLQKEHGFLSESGFSAGSYVVSLLYATVTWFVDLNINLHLTFLLIEIVIQIQFS